MPGWLAEITVNVGMSLQNLSIMYSWKANLFPAPYRVYGVLLSHGARIVTRLSPLARTQTKARVPGC